jgi:TolB-like protein
MRPIPVFVVLGLLAASAAAPAAEERRVRIAVLPLSNKIVKDPPDAKLFEEWVKGVVTRTLPDAQVFDRVQVYELLQAALGASLADKCEDLCVQERAKIVGADYSIDGSLTSLGDIVVLTLSLIETKSGATIASQPSTGRTTPDLLRDLDEAVKKLLQPITERGAREEARRKQAEQKAAEARTAELERLRQETELTRQRKELAQETRGRVWTWVAGGGAAVALGLAGVFGAQSKSTGSDITDGVHTRQEQDALRSTYQSQTGRANLMLGVGVGLAAVTATFFVLRF